MTTTFHKPTTQEIAVRDALEDIGNLETQHANQMVVNRAAEIAMALAADFSPTDIAVTITLSAIVGLNDEETIFVLSMFEKDDEKLVAYAKNFRYHTDYDGLRALMDKAA